MKNLYVVSVKNAVVILFLCVLAACVVGPQYHKPDTALPYKWIDANGEAAEDAKDAIEQQWWKHFNDPVLNQLIEKALASNVDIKIAQTRIDQARAMRSYARNDLLPNVDIKADTERQGNRLVFPPSASSLPIDLSKPFNTFEAGFDASWELDIFGAKRSAVTSATAELQAAEASRDDAKVSLLAEVARTYVDIRGYQEQIAIAHDAVAADSEALKIARERYKAGEAPKLDVTRAQAQLSQTQAKGPYYENLLLQSQYAMDVLINEQPGVTQKIVQTVMPVPAVDEKPLLAAPAAVIANRPDIRIAERKLASATAQQDIATAQFFPDLSLSGFFGLLTTQSDKFLNANSHSWDLGGSVIWPIFNFGKLTANLHQVNAEQQEALLTYQKSILVALSDVERAYAAYAKQQENEQLLAQTAKEDDHAIGIARMRYKAGLTSFLDVLDAERSFYQAQSQSADARVKLSQDTVALYKSLGGGWQLNEPSAPAKGFSEPAVTSH